MKFLIILAILIFPISIVAQTPVISPTVPVVPQGATQTFTCTSNCGTGGSWSCTGCAGSINPTTGAYMAPASVSNRQTCGGVPCLPNNHILNERIDSLPVNSSSSTWISGSGTTGINYYPS